MIKEWRHKTGKCFPCKALTLTLHSATSIILSLLHSLCILVGILDVNEERRACFQTSYIHFVDMEKMTNY